MEGPLLRMSRGRWAKTLVLFTLKTSAGFNFQAAALQLNSAGFNLQPFPSTIHHPATILLALLLPSN